MENFEKNLEKIKVLAKCKNKKLRNLLIKNSDKEVICTLCEIIDNILHGNIPLNEKTKNKLKKYKNILRKFIKKSSLNTKKKILIQKGGFLQILIPSVISAVASIIGSLISKKDE